MASCAPLPPGNCQFRSLADQMWHDQNLHKEIRRLVVGHMSQHRSQYAPFVTSEAFPAYIARMAKDGEWGDNVTLQVAADALEVEIVLVTSFPDNRSVVTIRPLVWNAGEGEEPASGKAVQRSKTLWLSFYAEIHYNSIDVKDAK